MSCRKIMQWLMLTGLLSASAGAQAVATLQDAVRKAIASNPEVQASWHAYTSSQYEEGAARGGYYPRLDLTSNIGRGELTRQGQATTDLTRRGAALTLSQMLYDGFATRNEVARLDHAKRVRYYELLNVSEQTSLEAARAYFDVLRHRELSRLAQENFAQHQQVFSQIQQRVQAGVSRRVDLEQAGGRMALAHSNMLTEASNLHDVSARYLRVVGELPPGEMIAPGLLKQGIPPNVQETLQLAFQGNPAFNAATENVRSAQADARSRESAFHPRVDLRARKDVSFNVNGIEGRRDDQTVELVLNYNLYRGGSDRARVRQFAERLALAKELRDKACREIRQTVSIAFNNIGSLQQQLGYLDQHQLAIEKAREAYRKQFDIGQRTLLDLLDTENEYFQARRAYNNATFDHAIAHARALAGMGELMRTLQVAREGLPSPAELGYDRSGVDPDTQCPAEAPQMAVIDVPPLPPRAATVPAVADPAPAPKPAAPTETVQQALTGWAAAWSAKDFPRYRSHYSSSFIPENGHTPEQWASSRAAQFARPGAITLGIDDLKVESPAADRAVTEFRQTYTSPNYRDVSTKRIEWVREGDRWKIQREAMLGAPQQVWVPNLVKNSKPKKKTDDCKCD